MMVPPVPYVTFDGDKSNSGLDQASSQQQTLADSVATITALAKAVDFFCLSLKNYYDKFQCTEQCGNTQRCSMCSAANLETSTLQKLTQGGYRGMHRAVKNEGESARTIRHPLGQP